MLTCGEARNCQYRKMKCTHTSHFVKCRAPARNSTQLVQNLQGMPVSREMNAHKKQLICMCVYVCHRRKLQHKTWQWQLTNCPCYTTWTYCPLQPLCLLLLQHKCTKSTTLRILAPFLNYGKTPKKKYGPVSLVFFKIHIQLDVTIRGTGTWQGSWSRSETGIISTPASSPL